MEVRSEEPEVRIAPTQNAATRLLGRAEQARQVADDFLLVAVVLVAKLIAIDAGAAFRLRHDAKILEFFKDRIVSLRRQLAELAEQPPGLVLLLGRKLIEGL